MHSVVTIPTFVISYGKDAKPIIEAKERLRDNVKGGMRITAAVRQETVYNLTSAQVKTR